MAKYSCKIFFTIQYISMFEIAITLIEKAQFYNIYCTIRFQKYNSNNTAGILQTAYQIF